MGHRRPGLNQKGTLHPSVAPQSDFTDTVSIFSPASWKKWDTFLVITSSPEIKMVATPNSPAVYALRIASGTSRPLTLHLHPGNQVWAKRPTSVASGTGV